MFTIAVLDLATAKKVAVWGTYGKDGYTHCKGTCGAHTYKEVRLIDCSTDHLRAILEDVDRQVGSISRYAGIIGDYETIIESILEDRAL